MFTLILKPYTVNLRSALGSCVDVDGPLDMWIRQLLLHLNASRPWERDPLPGMFGWTAETEKETASHWRLTRPPQWRWRSETLHCHGSYLSFQTRADAHILQRQGKKNKGWDRKESVSGDTTSKTMTLRKSSRHQDWQSWHNLKEKPTQLWMSTRLVWPTSVLWQ